MNSFSDNVSYFGRELPLQKIINALENTEDEELADFRDWLKSQCENSYPDLVCLNVNSPDLVAWQFYTVDHLSEMDDDFDADKWRTYRKDYEGDTISLDNEDIVYEAMELLESVN
jgi:hypothetical protein